MRFLIHHLTRYAYDRPVFLEPHLVRLRPRSDAFQHLIQHDLRVSPNPAGIASGIDAEGGPFDQLWFDQETDALEITTTSVVETLKTNPFDYLVLFESQRLPIQLDALMHDSLAHCLKRSEVAAGDESAPLRLLTHGLIGEVQGSPLAFLDRLSSTLFHRIRRITREEPGILSPSRTLGEGHGACRDMAVLFIELCRLASIPARFVSGYREGDPDSSEQELHAWAEVFLPGAGWRGYDPTLGLAVQNRHVALTASAHPQLTAPVSGTYRGFGAESSLQTSVRIETH